MMHRLLRRRTALWGAVAGLTACLAVDAASPPRAGSRVFLRTNLAPDPALAPALRDAGVETVVLPDNESDWDKVRQFHVWLILDWSPQAVNPAILRRFLDAGGGVFMSIWGSDLPSDNYVRWNTLLNPYGASVQRELVTDEAHRWCQPRWPNSFAWTDNFADSPITKGLAAVWFPDRGQSELAQKLWNNHMMVNSNWQPVVRTLPTGIAVGLTADSKLDTNRVTQCPPLLAVRQVGEGRMAVQSFPAFFNFSGGSALMVGDVVLSKGDGKRPSDGTKLLINTFRWLAAPSLASGRLGGYQPENLLPQKPWPGPPVTLEQWKWMRPRVENGLEFQTEVPAGPHHFRGLLGAHTELSDGCGTVAEQCQAAREAGYDFVIFTEHLPEMTPQKYDQLIAACKAATTNTFAAVPGLDAQVRPPWDPNITNLWNYLIYGLERFPDQRCLSKDGARFETLFDNFYFEQQGPGVATHSLGKTGFPGWFHSLNSCFALFTYRSGELIEDKTQEFRRQVENSACLMPVVVHLSYSVADIQKANRAPFQLYVNADRAPNEQAEEYGAKLRGAAHSLRYGQGLPGAWGSPQRSFVSSGPMIEEYGIVNSFPFDLRYLDRLRIVIGVSSATDLKTADIFDGERPYREYALGGNHARLATEDYVGKNRHFTVEASDRAGGKLYSSMAETRNWYNYSKMCSDHQNIIAGSPLYFKGHPGLVGFPAAPPNKVRFWAGEGDDGPGNANWIAIVGGDVNESGHPYNSYASAPPEWHMDLASPFVVIIDGDQRWKGSWGIPCVGPADPVHLHVKTYDFWPAVSAPPGNFSKDFPDYFAPHPPKIDWGLIEGTAELTRDVSPAGKTGPNLRFCGVRGGEGDNCAYIPAGSSDLKSVKKPDSGWNLDEVLNDRGMLVIAPVSTGGFCLYPLTPGLTFSLRSDGTTWNLDSGCHLDTPAKKGERFPVKFILARGVPGNTFEQDVANFKWFGEQFGILSPQPFYRMETKLGKVTSTRGLLELEAAGCGFLGKLTGADQVREVVGVRIRGLNSKWDAGVYVPERKWLRRIGFLEDTGYTSLDQTESRATFYMGNLLVCNHPDVDLRLLDSTKTWCRFTAHNSGTQSVAVSVSPAEGFQKVYAIPKFSQHVSIPAGASVTCDVGTPPPVPPWERSYDAVGTEPATGKSTTGKNIAADAGAKAVQVRVARVGIDKPGWMIWELSGEDEPTGPLKVVFRLKVEQIGGEDDVAMIQLRQGTWGKIFASSVLHGDDFKEAGKYQEFSLCVDRPATGTMDYEVHWLGKRDLYLDTVTVTQGGQ